MSSNAPLARHHSYTQLQWYTGMVSRDIKKDTSDSEVDNKDTKTEESCEEIGVEVNNSEPAVVNVEYKLNTLHVDPNGESELDNVNIDETVDENLDEAPLSRISVLNITL